MRRALSGFICLILGGVLSAGYWIYALKTPHTVSSVSFYVGKGEAQLVTLRRLETLKVIQHPWILKILTRFKLLPDFHYGSYKFPQVASDYDIIRILARGEVELRKVTIPEGVTMEEIAHLLAAQEITTATAFLEAARHPRILARFSLPASEAEGYLFPDTYWFPVSTAAEKVVGKLIENFFAHLPSDYAARATAVGLTLHEAVILASVIQKESYNPTEMPLVSAVFHNRLRKGMRLQADPSAIYRMPGYAGNLTRLHLRTYTPYNTYVIFGLPQGPIGNPGLSALLSAVLPAPVDYLYFVARGDGTHVFSSTYREHRAYVEQYQKGKRTPPP